MTSFNMDGIKDSQEKVPSFMDRQRDRLTVKAQAEKIAELTAIVEAQKEEIATLSAIVECNSSTILSQGGEMLYLNDMIETATRSREEIVLTAYENIRTLIPCFDVGIAVRKRVMELSMSRLNYTSLDISVVKAGNSAAHYGRPLADATVLDLTTACLWKDHYFEQRYGVPWNIVLDMQDFPIFITLLELHGNMNLFQSERSTQPKVAESYLKRVQQLIAKVYPNGEFETNSDFEDDGLASIEYQSLVTEGRAARQRHDKRRQVSGQGADR